MFRTPQNIFPDYLANFVAFDPIVPKGVIAVNIDEDDGRAKVGDGFTHWSSLGYIGSSVIEVGGKSFPSTVPTNHQLIRFNSTLDKWDYTLQGYIDIESNWISNNEIFPTFAILIETDDSTNDVTGRIKVSDGITPQDEIPWVGFNYSDWPTNYSPYYNGASLDYKQYQPYNELQFVTTPEGKVHKDDGTWGFPTIYAGSSLVETDLLETDNAYVFATLTLGGFPTEPTSVTITTDGTSLLVDGSKVWTSYNDGHTSGLDADTLDTYHASHFASTGHTQNASTVNFATGGVLPTTYKTLQDYMDIQAAGRIYGGLISDNGDGTVAISAGYGLIKTNGSSIEGTRFVNWPTTTPITLTDESTNYIYLDYNSGSPTVYATINRNDIDLSHNIGFGRVYKSGTLLSIIQSGNEAFCITSRIHERLIYTDGGLVRSSGGVISATGTRNIASTAGSFYLGLNNVTTSAKDTSVSDSFKYWYRNGSGGWTSVYPQTQISNTQYDNGTGTLATLSNNQYGVHWVYIEYNGNLHVVYGQESYTLTNAQNATIPSSIPTVLSNFAILSAKIIIEKSAISFTSIISAYTTVFPVSSPSVHNDLSGLQGGTTDEYYHLTNSRYTSVNNLSFPSGRFGDSTNYAEFSTTGTLKLYGSATTWNDLRIEPVARNTGTYAPAFEKYIDNGSSSHGIYLYSFDDALVSAEKEVFFTMQMPHDWAQTAITIHVHFIPYTTVASSAVRWGLEYNWANPNTVFPATTIVYTSTTTSGDTTLTQYKHYKSEFTSITPSASQNGLSSILMGRLFRNSSDAGDTYTDKVGLLYIDAHYEINDMGSNTISTK